MLNEFITDEKGQGAIEYILTVGTVILAAVVIFSIYSKMNESAIQKINSTSDAATSVMSSKINASIVDMS